MKDLRYYLKYLEEHAPEQLLRVKKEVDTRFEITGIVRKLAEEERYPVILCEKVKEHSMSVITNLLYPIRNQALALEVDEANFMGECSQRLSHPIKPKLVGNGPVKEVILKGEKVDLGKLPILTHAEKDRAPYITIGVTTAKDPDTGIRNWGIYRIMYRGERNRLGVYFIGGGVMHMGHIYHKMEERKKALEVAVVIGHHPGMVMASFGWGNYGDDEIDAMGALLGEPVELVKCETVDLEVPASAEIVIEGKIPPQLRESEAPFGEYTRYYGPERLNPVIEVTAITHRKDAIYHDDVGMWIYKMGARGVGLPIAGLWTYKKMKETIPQVVEVYSSHPYTLFVKLKVEFDGLAKQAGLTALGLGPMPKFVVVVDEDIDIRNAEEVFWAIATRTRPDRDFCFIYDVYTNPLEPSGYTIRSRSEPNGLNTNLLIDATKPVGIPFPERCDVPKEYWQDLDIEALTGS